MTLLLVILLATSTSLLAASKTNAAPVKLSFDTLKKWTYVEGKTPIPDSIKKLDGQYVEMRGFMMSPDTADDIHDFVLVPSLWGCCYGKPIAVNHVVLVKLKRGLKTTYYEDALLVRGRLHVGEERIDGVLISLYRLDADEVGTK